jgi:hypothetical protein
MGGGAYFGFDGNAYKPMVAAGIANGTNISHTWISTERMIEVGTRVLETEMKVRYLTIIIILHYNAY